MRALFLACLCCWQIASAQMSVIDKAVCDITMVIRHDVFTAPAASRIYAYTTYAGYLSMNADNDIPLNLRNAHQLPVGGSENDTVGALTMYLTATAFVFSDTMLMNRSIRNIGVVDTTCSNYHIASSIARAVINWSTEDQYAKAISLPRYSLLAGPLYWRPTPPDYAAGSDPNWGSLKPFQYKLDTVLIPMPDFFADSNLLVKAAMDMYAIAQNNDSVAQETALFWDDNPFIIKQSGHLQVAEKKVSPPGHWLDITREAIRIHEATGQDAIKAYALVSIAMADAMIAVWDLKYQVQLLRPETYINTRIDTDWRPYLQTPPFPEFPSGHSAVSAAAATILTSLFGDGQAFTDASETVYGLPERHFTSYADAAAEASVSRVLGGIHFQPAIEIGAKIGEASARSLLESAGLR